MIPHSQWVCENNLKEEDVKSMGRELGQVLGNQFNPGEGSFLTQCRH